jgi:non-ribosomal peptide synthase protein (TIGR01720 family)
MAVDVSSWQILLRDWQELYRKIQVQASIDLPFIPTTFAAWTKHLETYANSLRLMRERTYWLGLPWKQVRSIPVDFPGGENSEGSARTLTVALDAQETSGLLYEVSRVYHLQAYEALLVACVEMQERWTGAQTLLIDVEGHGREDIREDIDLSHTVGWLTAVSPLCLHTRESDTIEERVTALKEQIRAVPNGGIGYGLLRYKGKDRALRQQLASLPQSEMVFHYRGRALVSDAHDELVVPAADVSSSALDPASPRTHLLAFEGYLAEQRLHIAVTYSEQLYRQETIEKLLGWYRGALRTLIAHCQQQNKIYVSPQDFPEANLDQSELDSMLTSLYEEMES